MGSRATVEAISGISGTPGLRRLGLQRDDKEPGNPMETGTFCGRVRDQLLKSVRKAMESACNASSIWTDA